VGYVLSRRSRPAWTCVRLGTSLPWAWRCSSTLRSQTRSSWISWSGLYWSGACGTQDERSTAAVNHAAEHRR